MKKVFYNKKGAILLIDGKIPEDDQTSFAKILVSVVVYDHSSRQKYELILVWERIAEFPKNTVYQDNISNLKHLLKEKNAS